MSYISTHKGTIIGKFIYRSYLIKNTDQTADPLLL